jgi:hypothetical protein
MRGFLPFALMLASVAAPLAAQDPAPGLVPADMAQRVAIADRLMAAMRLDRQFDTVIPQMVNAMMPMLMNDNSGKEVQVRRILSEELNTSFASKKADFIASSRDIYARNFTVAQLHDILGFYTSSTGKVMVDKLPALASESMMAGAAIGRKAAQDAMPHVFERMRAAQLSVPKGA